MSGGRSGNMKSMNEIRRNQRAVQETRQITNAMYLLSTSRMKRAMSQIGYNQVYMRRIRAAVKDVLDKAQGAKHRYLDSTRSERAAFVVMASDKGLCGAYNANVVHLAEQKCALYSNPYVTTVGICSTKMLQSRGIPVHHEWLGASQQPSIYYARQIGEALVGLYRDGAVDEVYVVYTHYYSQVKQEAVCVRLLPLSAEDFGDVSLEYNYQADIIYEPSIEAVFDTLVPQYVIGLVYGCLNQASASEHVTRMNAMQNATHNADEMLRRLNFEYSMARQTAVTNEITEIAAAMEIIGTRSV